MTFCCDAFGYRFRERHERGLFVYVLPPLAGFPTEPLFHVGMRALERSRFGELQEAMKGGVMTGCMSLSGGTGIDYCPWCGAKLGRFYRRSWRELIDEKISDEFRASFHAHLSAALLSRGQATPLAAGVWGEESIGEGCYKQVTPLGFQSGEGRLRRTLYRTSTSNPISNFYMI
jgi:hypothetical protein